MNRLSMIQRVRNLTRDLSNSIFRESDIVDYLNEAIERIGQVIVELQGMNALQGNDDEPILLPKHYHQLIPLYSASRCFSQDERHYQATNFMNEFESKLEELRNQMESGVIVLTDSSGNPIVSSSSEDYVTDNYFNNRNNAVDVDNGVEGV